MASTSGVCLQLGNSRIWLAQGNFTHGAPSSPYICFQTPEIKYIPWNDDFGPMNAFSITEFVSTIEGHLMRRPNKQVVYVVKEGQRNLTNAVFLLGAYMILIHDVPTQDIWRWFHPLESNEFGLYKDASRVKNSFRLSLLDCFHALEKAKSLRWFCKPDKHGVWGTIDPIEYAHYDNPLDGNMHIIIPDRMIAFHGPKYIGGNREFCDDLETGHRTFSPQYYVDIFAAMRVTTVLRLNQSYYDKKEFESAGFRHVDLPFLDGTLPSEQVVRHFFDLVDRTQGMIAIHCSSGLGRTGTLIALYLMRDYGFTAREAMGWLRIVRPGCVLGEQQCFLCEVERRCAARYESGACRAKSKSRAHLGGREPSASSARPLSAVAEGGPALVPAAAHPLSRTALGGGGAERRGSACAAGESASFCARVRSRMPGAARGEAWDGDERIVARGAAESTAFAAAMAQLAGGADFNALLLGCDAPHTGPAAGAVRASRSAVRSRPVTGSPCAGAWPESPRGGGSPGGAAVSPKASAARPRWPAGGQAAPVAWDEAGGSGYADAGRTGQFGAGLRRWSSEYGMGGGSDTGRARAAAVSARDPGGEVGLGVQGRVVHSVMRSHGAHRC